MAHTLSALERVIEPEAGTLPPDAARYLLSLRFSAADHARCETLSAKARSGEMTPEESAELDDLLTANDVLMILKSKARRSLGTGGGSPSSTHAA
jgi:hypothetical protein